MPGESRNRESDSILPTTFHPTDSASVAQLPASTGSSLGATEGDPIVQQTIIALEKISETKLALVAHGLTTVLEGFIPVRSIALSVSWECI